jgi:DcuC family C4-dicarboxylate transporter
VTSGAALLLGCSIGGELLNPGAPEWITVARELGIDGQRCVSVAAPLLFLQLAVATPLFWWLSQRADAKELAVSEPSAASEVEFRVNFLKAAVPLVPVALLFVTGPPLSLVEVPREWLIDPARPGDAANFASRRIGAAMLLGVVLAALTAPRRGLETAQVFFEGAGYAMTHIISLIVAATCFGKGVEGIGVKEVIGDLIGGRAAVLFPAAGALPLGFSMLCGSGMATTQALFGFFVESAREAGVEPMRVGAVVAIAAAAGRTMSPVAAVVLMSGRLTETEPLRLVRRVMVPLMAATAVMVAGALLGL